MCTYPLSIIPKDVRSSGKPTKLVLNHAVICNWTCAASVATSLRPFASNFGLGSRGSPWPCTSRGVCRLGLRVYEFLGLKAIA